MGELGKALKHVEVPEGETLIKIGTGLISKDNVHGDILEFLGWVDKLAVCGGGQLANLVSSSQQRHGINCAQKIDHVEPTLMNTLTHLPFLPQV